MRPRDNPAPKERERGNGRVTIMAKVYSRGQGSNPKVVTSRATAKEKAKDIRGPGDLLQVRQSGTQGSGVSERVVS